MEDINLKATNMQEELTETHGHGQQLSGNSVAGRDKGKGGQIYDVRRFDCGW